MAAEKKLDNSVIDFLESVGAWKLKYWGGAKYTKQGIPDILACVNGYFFGIEDKAPNGKPSLLQLKNLEWIRKAGGYGILLYPNDFDNFKTLERKVIFANEPDIDSWQWYQKNVYIQNEWEKKLLKN